MEHQLAAKSKAVERYVLGELGPEERDAFEDHYFSCDECAGDVRALSIFVENAKAVLREPVVAAAPVKTGPARSRGWFGWLQPQLAFGGLAAALALTVGIQGMRISRLSEPVVTATAVLHGESRGDVPAAAAGQPIALVLALEEHPAAGTPITLEIRSDSGSLVRTLKAEAPADDKALSVTIRDPKLSPGRYAVVIGNIKYPFEVR